MRLKETPARGWVAEDSLTGIETRPNETVRDAMDRAAMSSLAVVGCKYVYPVMQLFCHGNIHAASRIPPIVPLPQLPAGIFGICAGRNYAIGLLESARAMLDAAAFARNYF